MSNYLTTNKKKITATRFQQMKAEGEKISMLTCYDYSMAKLLDTAGVDAILIGDSASNVMIGNSTTLPITLDEMIYHARCVVNGISYAFVVADMPFGTVHGDKYVALASAIRMIKESGVDAVKIEGGEEVRDSIELIINAGIPVVAHLGLTPQSVNQLGGYGVQAKGEAEAEKLIKNAKLLESLGCCALVLEKIPSALAKRVTVELSIPTIGIGAGNDTDGQVLVLQDMLGITQGFKPKFLRQFAQVGEQIINAVSDYNKEVKSGGFPNKDESY
ncbi:3-methyl-2-oxobutanoate hydroxymethyltransferase [Porphyromonadaceae bacterium W3.11]|nr:3-methyl-2-oxobutanoate hydroxymethyltransferase [Porphyromonadaceae bacterium W3.11]